MSAFSLKMIALGCMVADHIGFVFFPQNIVLRLIGRLSFPIFAFLIAQGFKHTKDVRKYLIRLAVFAVASEIPFDLVVSGKLYSAQQQNIFFTLLLGLMALMLYDWFQSRRRLPVAFLSVFTVCFVGQALNASYGFAGVLFIFICYVCREKQVFVPWFILGVCCTAMYAFAASGPRWALIQLASLTALPILLRYNGQRGRSLKFMFYAAYPAHLLILYLIYTYFPIS